MNRSEGTAGFESATRPFCRWCYLNMPFWRAKLLQMFSTMVEDTENVLDEEAFKVGFPPRPECSRSMPGVRR